MLSKESRFAFRASLYEIRVIFFFVKVGLFSSKLPSSPNYSKVWYSGVSIIYYSCPESNFEGDTFCSRSKMLDVLSEVNFLPTTRLFYSYVDFLKRPQIDSGPVVSL